MSKTIRTIALAAVTVVSAASVLAAEQNNPLHPSFYAAKAPVASKVPPPLIPYVFSGDAAGRIVDPKQWMEIWLDDDWAPAPTQTQAYTDTRNPLHPSYGRKSEAGSWTEAGFSFSRIYVDRNNPLHPGYKR